MRAAERREQVREKLLEKADWFLDLTSQPTKIFVGQRGDEKELDRPPAGDIRNLVVAAAVALDKHELLSNRPTTRTETSTIRDEFRDDHERETLRRIIDAELRHRGETVPES